jgi:hypothetical protein
MQLTRKQAAALQGFIAKWITQVVPGVNSIKFTKPDGRVLARDSLGWRDVGTVHYFAALARALGRLPA